jgi:hypothetical protein
MLIIDGHLDALALNIAASDLVTGRVVVEVSHIERIYQTLLQEIYVQCCNSEEYELPEWLWRALEIPHWYFGYSSTLLISLHHYEWV